MSSDESLAADSGAGGDEPIEAQAPAPPVVAKSNAAPAAQKPAGRGRPFLQKFMGLHEIKGAGIFRKALAEFTGTLLLVFIACGAAMGSGDAVVISLSFGFTVATIVQTLGHVSGGHLNPAVSFGLIPAGHCGIARATVYLVAQSLGSLVGAILLWVAVPDASDSRFKLGTTQIQNGLKVYHRSASPRVPDTYETVFSSYLQAILIEFIITFVLVLLVCGVLDKLRNKDVKGFAPLAVGLAIAIGHFLGARFTGPSMNPARSFGPALVYALLGTAGEGETTFTPFFQLGVYFIGPIGGGIVAGILYRLVFKERESFDNDEELRAEAENGNPAQTSKA